MWLRVSLCVSLVWLLVGRQGGSGSPGTCQHAQDMYIAVSSAYTSEQLNSVTISSDLAGKIFAEPSRGVVDGVCKLQSTCCSKEAEEILRLSVGDGYHVNIINLLSDRVLSCYNSSFKSAMALYFSDSRDSLVETMRAAYSTRFERYINIFDDFYDYLRDAMYTGSICEIGNKFMQVNFEVFLAAFLGGDSGAQFVELLKSPLYRSCFYDNFVNLYSSELGHTYSFRHFTNILNQTMHYLRALYISDHIIESVLSQGLTKQCRNAILKMTHCSQCAGYSSPATCSGLCLNTMRGCLVDLSDLAEPFRQFTQAVVWMKEQVEPIINQLTFIHVHFLNVIQFVNSERQAISKEMQSRCNISGRVGRSAPSGSGASVVSPATLLPPSLQFNESAYCLARLQPAFSHLPELVCEGEEEVSEGNENCWNGRLVGSYDREVTNYTREAQRDNPEVLLCVSREPRYRTQISLLQYITRELNILTYKHVCSYDDEDCTVDLTDICEYYQLPQSREDSYEPTSVSSGDLEFEQQADACEDDPTAGLHTDLECTLDQLPVVGDDGELEACLPCFVGSTRMSQNDTECTQCKLQYFPVEGNFPCRVCPPGSERPDQNSTSCVCNLLYYPVIQNNNLVSCMHCPAGSSRLSQDDLHCTCALRFYPVMQKGELLECRPCPVGSSRLNHSANTCTCQLQLYPDLSSHGMLQECHPCPTNSARMNPADLMCTCSGNTVTEIGNRITITETEICNICPLEYTVVANNTAGLYLCEPCRPPGSRRLSHADESCTCGLEYYPVVQNGALQACNRCPPGSSRLSLSDTECSCNPDYYDSTVRKGPSRGLQCRRCPAGSARSQNATECKCQSGLLSSGDNNFSLRCLHCPMNSEKKTDDDRVCTCLENTRTINGSTATNLDVCILPMLTTTSSRLATSHSQGLMTTVLAIMISCIAVIVFVIVVLCVIRRKRNSKSVAYMEEVDLNFHPVDVSRSLAASESITTELWNLNFEEKHCEVIQTGGCTSEGREQDLEIANDSNQRYQLAGNTYDPTQRYELAGSAYDPTQRYELAGSAYDPTQRYELAGSAYDPTQRYELAGSTYDPTQRYELAGSTYDPTQRYELAGSTYDPIEQYELAGNAYDQIQSYEQADSDYKQMQGNEQSCMSPYDHVCIDSDAAESCNTGTLSADSYKHTNIDANENIQDAHGTIKGKEQAENDADGCRETTNSPSYKRDSDICEQVQEASSCDQVQSEIVSSYGQVQSYQQAHSAYDVIQDYSQVPYYEQTSNPCDQTQDYENVCAYESFRGQPVDSDTV